MFFSCFLRIAGELSSWMIWGTPLISITTCPVVAVCIFSGALASFSSELAGVHSRNAVTYVKRLNLVMVDFCSERACTKKCTSTITWFVVLLSIGCFHWRKIKVRDCHKIIGYGVENQGWIATYGLTCECLTHDGLLLLISLVCWDVGAERSNRHDFREWLPSGIWIEIVCPGVG